MPLISDTPLLVAYKLATSGQRILANNNSAGLIYDIAVTGADATSHSWEWDIDANPFFAISATGDGAGSITSGALSAYYPIGFTQGMTGTSSLYQIFRTASTSLNYNVPSSKTHDFTVNALKALEISGVANAVNYISLTNSPTGVGTSLGAAGSDTDINFYLTAKGAGGIQLTAGNGFDFLVNRVASSTAKYGIWAGGSASYGLTSNASANFSGAEWFNNLTVTLSGTSGAAFIAGQVVNGLIITSVGANTVSNFYGSFKSAATATGGVTITNNWVDYSTGGMFGIFSGLVLKRRTLGSTSNLALTDNIVGVSFITAGDTYTLPAPTVSTAGKVYTIKDQSGTAGTNAITVNSASGTIDGAASVLIDTNYGSKSFYHDGTNYFVY